MKGQWISNHGKFTLKMNFQHFTDSRFTPVLCRDFLLTLNSSNFIGNQVEFETFLLKLMKNGENCHSLISHFTCVFSLVNTQNKIKTYVINRIPWAVSEPISVETKTSSKMANLMKNQGQSLTFPWIQSPMVANTLTRSQIGDK